MLIDIRNIPIVIITTDKSQDRYWRLISELNQIGCSHETNIFTLEAKRNTNHAVGCAVSHLRALRTFNPPFLILEDDAHMVSRQTVFATPDNADALYLGYFNVPHKNEYSCVPENDLFYSLHGTWPHYEKAVDADGLYRVNSIMSTHSILYLSASYINIACSRIEKCIETQTDIDVMFSKLQLLTNVYAVEFPVFCQLDPNKPDFYKISTNSIFTITDWQGNVINE